MTLNWWMRKRDHNMARKEAMEFSFIEWTLRLRWKNKRMRRGWRSRRGEVIKSHRIMNRLLNSNSLLLHLLQIWSSWMSVTNMAESFGLNPYLWIHPELPVQICETSRNQGSKRNQATVSCWSSQQSYLVWACHLSGQWMHEIREGEEEENVSTTGGAGDKGGRDLGGREG